ncbi:hypothetical protein HWV07_07130 [Natronomonas salina]|uniref:DUF7504 family protein n=1 Tax=Natronomonas salina TaxID=1710540 RepID=UPI0015B7189A|nr:hypothetical protein [Natronomonas salina]QLD88818.1 hypothetical protein HWV07_07130 [Natronomonas salina]
MPPSQSSDDSPIGNYLYVSPTLPATDDSCFDRFEAVRPAETHLVVITRSIEETLANWRRVHDDPPANVSIVSVAEETRSTAGQEPATGSPRAEMVWPVSHPGDLTGIEIAITEILTQRPAGGQLVVCFQALDAVVQYAAVKPTYRFLHKLTTRLKTADAIAHYHVADFQLDGDSVTRIRPLFDGVIEIDDDLAVQQPPSRSEETTPVDK